MQRREPSYVTQLGSVLRRRDVAALRAENAQVRAELAQAREMIAQLQKHIADLEQRQLPQPSGTDATGGASDTTTDYVGGKIRGYHRLGQVGA